MELAFREESRSEVELRRIARHKIAGFSIFVTVSAFLLHTAAPGRLYDHALDASWFIGFLGALAALFFPRKRSLVKIIAAFFIPPAAVLLSAALSPFLSARPFIVLLCGIPALWLMYSTKSKAHPFGFYREWLFTAPHLKPETRRQRDRIRTPGEQSLLARLSYALLPLIVFLTVLVGAAYSPALAVLFLFAVGLYFNDFNPWATVRLAERVLTRFLTYASSPSGASGVWIPEKSLKRRRWTIGVAVFLFHFALLTGLCLYSPADLFAIRQQITECTIPGKPHDERLVAATIGQYYSLESLEKKYLGGKGGSNLGALYRMITERHYNSQEATRKAVNALQAAQSNHVAFWRLLYFFILPFLAALTLPNLLILALFRQSLQNCEELRVMIEGGPPTDPVSRIRRRFSKWFRDGSDKQNEWLPGIDDDGRNTWQWNVDRIKNSTHVAVDPLGNTVREAEHLFLGVEPALQIPVLLDKRIASEHCYIAGQTGSGKTSLGIMPLLIQLIRGHLTPAKADGVSINIENATQGFTNTPPTPIVIIDLKGDLALFHTARIEAERRGQAFRFFTPEKGKVSHYFNPFFGFKSESRTFIQLCHLFLDSLSLNHGEGYGRSYYSRRSRQALFDALNHPSRPQTFPALAEVMVDMMQKAEYKDAYEVFSTINALAQYESLVTTEERERDAPQTTINMQTVIEESQVVYFWLPSAIESITAKEIGKLALFTLLSAAIDRKLTRPGEETRQVYLFIDEFQRLAGENFKIILEQARSFGISAILANQTPSDLRSKDFDLRPTISTNTRLQLYFTVNDPREIKMLSALSGEEIRVLKNWTTSESLMRVLFRRDSQSATSTETFKDRLTTNDILSISDHPFEMIACISRGSGYTQFGGLPIRVRTSWPLTPQEYGERSRTSWPSQEEFPLGEVLVNLKSPREIEAEARQDLLLKQQEKLRQVLGDVLHL